MQPSFLHSTSPKINGFLVLRMLDLASIVLDLAAQHSIWQSGFPYTLFKILHQAMLHSNGSSDLEGFQRSLKREQRRWQTQQMQHEPECLHSKPIKRANRAHLQIRRRISLPILLASILNYPAHAGGHAQIWIGSYTQT